MQAGPKTVEPRRPRVVAVPTVFRLSSPDLLHCFLLTPQMSTHGFLLTLPERNR